MAWSLPTITTELPLLRLLHLCSPALPVGAYAFSQGLEAAYELGWLRDVQAVEAWLTLQLQHSVATVDLPILLRVHQACADCDAPRLQQLNTLLLACRETAELQLADTAMGEALARLLPKLDVPIPVALQPPLFLPLFTCTAQHWQLSAEHTALGYAWAWLENQILAATKLVPLGQTQAQQLLHRLQGVLPMALQHAQTLDDDAIGASLPALAYASSYHETQYTRLFRS